MVGLPGGQSRPGLLGVETVHLSDRITTVVQDLFQLTDVVSLGTDVQLAVEGEAPGHGNGLSTIDGEQGVTRLHHLAVLYCKPADLAGGGRRNRMQLVATQFPAYRDLVGQGPHAHRLGDGPVHPRTRRCLVGPRLPDDQADGRAAEQDEQGQDLFHARPLRGEWRGPSKRHPDR